MPLVVEIRVDEELINQDNTEISVSNSTFFIYTTSDFLLLLDN
jgi:hypothetical protein